MLLRAAGAAIGTTLACETGMGRSSRRVRTDGRLGGRRAAAFAVRDAVGVAGLAAGAGRCALPRRPAPRPWRQDAAVARVVDSDKLLRRKPAFGCSASMPRRRSTRPAGGTWGPNHGVRRSWISRRPVELTFDREPTDRYGLPGLRMARQSLLNEEPRRVGRGDCSIATRKR